MRDGIVQVPRETAALLRDGRLPRLLAQPRVPDREGEVVGEVCRERDVKGLYARAEAGAVAQFTGVSAPYEPPASPDLVIDTSDASINQCAMMLLETWAIRSEER